LLNTVLSSSATISSFLLSLGKLAFLKYKDTYYIRFAKANEQMREQQRWKTRGKYSIVNKTIKTWKLLPAGKLAYFPCILNAF